MSDGKPINAMKSDVVDVSKQLAQGRVSNIDLALIDSWSDERNVRDVIEAYEYEPDIVVQLYFKPINKEKGVWEHYPTSKHKGDVHVLLHSNVSFFSAHLETDILNALDEAKITKSSIHAESRHVKFLLPDFGETTYIRPQREDGIIKLSFKLLEYGDVVEGSVKFRKNAPYNLLSIGGN